MTRRVHRYGIIKLCLRHQRAEAIDTVYTRVSSGPDWDSPGAPQPLLGPTDRPASGRPISGRRSSALGLSCSSAAEELCVLGCCASTSKPKRLRRPGWALLSLLMFYASVDATAALLSLHNGNHCDDRWVSHIKQGCDSRLCLSLMVGSQAGSSSSTRFSLGRHGTALRATASTGSTSPTPCCEKQKISRCRGCQDRCLHSCLHSVARFSCGEL